MPAAKQSPSQAKAQTSVEKLVGKAQEAPPKAEFDPAREVKKLAKAHTREDLVAVLTQSFDVQTTEDTVFSDLETFLQDIIEANTAVPGEGQPETVEETTEEAPVSVAPPKPATPAPPSPPKPPKKAVAKPKEATAEGAETNGEKPKRRYGAPGSKNPEPEYTPEEMAFSQAHGKLYEYVNAQIEAFLQAGGPKSPAQIREYLDTGLPDEERHPRWMRYEAPVRLQMVNYLLGKSKSVRREPIPGEKRGSTYRWVGTPQEEAPTATAETPEEAESGE
jgi:hypothetical protein